jgi:3-deoxy-manno-octulosonate cytidylyltransferase (CMP-KDO synthetase)
MSDLIVIPARYASKRLPGKPLHPIAGRSLLERVLAIGRRAAELAGDCNVVVATDDARIANHAHDLGADVVMTASDLASGSDRACAAAAAQKNPPEFVINLQGDAPFTAPEIVPNLLTTLRAGGSDVATPVYRLSWEWLDQLRAHKLETPFSGTTCVRGADGAALWFSKSIQPAIREEAHLRTFSQLSPVWQHLGLYGYRLDALQWFSACEASPYEQLEGLEQLRFLEHGKRVMTLAVEPPLHPVSGIDTPADVQRAEDSIARLGDPFCG